MKKLLFFSMLISLFSLSFASMAAETGEKGDAPKAADHCADDKNNNDKLDQTTTTEEATKPSSAVTQ